MKTIIAIIADSFCDLSRWVKALLILGVIALAGFMLTGLTGCSTPPSARVVQVQSLKAVGQSAEAAVALSARLFKDGRITPAQARAVLDFYDNRLQPAFRLAVATAKADLSTPASPDVSALASQLLALVASLQ